MKPTDKEIIEKIKCLEGRLKTEQGATRIVTGWRLAELKWALTGDYNTSIEEIRD